MRTLEEVREHLSRVVYYDDADKNAIIGFLFGKGLLHKEDEPLDFVEPDKHEIDDFIDWFEESKEDKKTLDLELLIDDLLKETVLKESDKMGIEVTRLTLSDEFNKLNEKAKKERDAALDELDKAEKELEEKVGTISDPKLKQLAELFIGFAKELKEEAKKKMNA